MTIVATPAVIAGVILSQTVRLGITRKWEEWLEIMLFVALFSIGFLLIYYAYINFTISTRASVGLTSKPIVVSIGFVMTKVRFWAGLWILVVVLYLPWFFTIKKYSFLKPHLILLLASIMFAGSVFWAIISPGIDVFQFFTHISFAILNYTIALFIILFIFSLSFYSGPVGLLKSLGIVVFLLWCITSQLQQQRFIYSFSNAYSNDYLHDVQQAIDDMQNGVGVSLLKPGYVFDGSALGEQLGDYLFIMRPLFYTLTISTLDMISSSDIRKKDLALMAFTQFVNRQKAEGTFQSIPQSQADFIRKHRMGYLIASKSAIVPPTIQPMITDSIVDSKSGERFYLLKP